MCSFSACKNNKACKELFDRIVSKGKSKKLALIAVANKLLKQSLAIAKSGMMYDEQYQSLHPSRGCKVNCVKVKKSPTLIQYEQKRRTI